MVGMVVAETSISRRSGASWAPVISSYSRPDPQVGPLTVVATRSTAFAVVPVWPGTRRMLERDRHD